MARILVLDDAPDLALVLRMQLERAGHEGITAANGRRARSRFFEERPALGVRDLRMPELAGWQPLDRLRALAGVRVVAHSGSTPTPEELARLRPGVDAFVGKPARAPEPPAVVDALLVGDLAA